MTRFANIRTFAIIAIFFVIVGPARAQTLQLMPPGATAPKFNVSTTDGNIFSLKSQRGKVVIVEFWATWCLACRMEAATLIDLQKRFHGHGLEIISLSLDDSRTAPNVKPFVRIAKIKYHVSDSTKMNYRIAQRYSPAGFPSLYLIDKSGFVRWSRAGYSENDDQALSKLIKRALRAKT